MVSKHTVRPGWRSVSTTQRLNRIVSMLSILSVRQLGSIQPVMTHSLGWAATWSETGYTSTCKVGPSELFVARADCTCPWLCYSSLNASHDHLIVLVVRLNTGSLCEVPDSWWFILDHPSTGVSFRVQFYAQPDLG